MSWTALAEEKIAAAFKEGVFDRLPGRGQPIDLDAYFQAPPSMRAGFGLLKSAGVLPLEVEALREIAQLRQRLEAETRSDVRADLQRYLTERETAFNIAMERLRAMKRRDATEQFE